MREHKQQQPPAGIVPAFQAAESALKQYLMRFFVRQQDIEDVVQETFLRAFESEKTQTITSPRSFLFRVAKNIALSELSRKANHLIIYMGDLGELEVIDSRPSLEEALEIRARLTSLSRTADALPPQCRRVLIMRKVFGFSHKEIARRLNISARTVEKHLTKALQRCQETGAAPETTGTPAREGQSTGTWRERG
ncbi:MAG: RNA polymerase sigma factor [Gammaproteobacteria bacterium]|jgi:RNA polymerase sigma factor (sigma-70 family)